MKRARRVLSFTLAILMTAAVSAGCGKHQAAQTGKTAKSVTFPLSAPVTLKIWKPAISVLIGQYPDQSQLPIYQELTKKTGINFKILCPAVGEEKDQFNLMVSSGDLPDILDETSVNNYYPGGIVKASTDGIITKLNDLQNKYAPDLLKIYNTYKGVDAYVKDENGNYLAVPFIRGQQQYLCTSGLIMRKDWLDKLGLTAPTTIDEWYTTLSAFKNKLGATAPLLDLSLPLYGAYGISSDYFMEGGKVKYGPADSRYKNFLTEMAKWYKEGLIDPEIATNNSKTKDAKACSDRAGAFSGSGGNGIGRYEQQMASANPSYKLIGVQSPTLKKDETSRFYNCEKAVSSGAVCCITSKCKNQDVAMSFLNYGYTKEGYVLYNFGVEGTTFNWENGYPKFTSTITKNSQGLSFTAALQMYARSPDSGPFVQDPRYQEQYFALPEQMDAFHSWTKYKDSASGGNSPTLRGVMNQTETSETAPVDTQISTYVNEMLYKFLEGQTPINDSTFNAYLAQLKTLGLDTAVKNRQSAEDRFKKANPTLYTDKSEINVYDMYKNITK